MIGCLVWPDLKGSIKIECQEINQSKYIKHKQCQLYAIWRAIGLTNSIVTISVLVASSLEVPSPTGRLFVNHRAFEEIVIANLGIYAQCSEFTFMTFWQPLLFPMVWPALTARWASAVCCNEKVAPMVCSSCLYASILFKVCTQVSNVCAIP